MIKKGFLLLSLLAAAATADAGSISMKEARNIAINFLNAAGRPAGIQQMRLAAKGGSAQTADYYVFNNGGGRGFVIVAGDDRA